MSHGPGISNITVSSLQINLHFDSFMQSPLAPLARTLTLEHTALLHCLSEALV